MLMEILKNELNRVEVRELGLILWENDATPLISIFRPVLDQNMQKKINKFKSMPEQPWAHTASNSQQIGTNPVILVA